MDRPIIFSPVMIRALLDGRKTQTRRLAWRESRLGSTFEGIESASPWQRVQPGDRLWVREGFTFGSYNPKQAKRRQRQGQNPVVYATDRERMKQYAQHRWRPSIHMPRWASRLTLTVTATKIERLQEISHDDAVAEGVGIFPPSMSAQKRFRELWESLRGPGSWAANPEVVAISFKCERRNIDAKEIANG